MNRIPRLRIARSKIGQRFNENSEAKEESEVKEYNDEDKEGNPMRRRSAGLRTKGGRGVQVGGQGVCFFRSKVGVWGQGGGEGVEGRRVKEDDSDAKEEKEYKEEDSEYEEYEEYEKYEEYKEYKEYEEYEEDE